ncbi:MAG: hypothetical protein FWG27_08765 [Treponema sp.]|nr:hypothetical protein [Treponema sp.]
MIEEGETLDTMLKKYRQGLVDRKELEGKLFIYIKNNPRRFYLSTLKSDIQEDFISWLYPRLSKAVDHYTDQGSSFDSYLAAMVRLSIREYTIRKKEHQIIEKTWWNAKAEEMKAAEEEPEYMSTLSAPKKVSNPRQVLMLLLKSYYYLSDAHLARIAPALGLEKENLFHMIDKIRISRVQREEAINGLKDRIHCQFYRCLTFEKRMMAATCNSAHWIRMKHCLETARKRLLSMRRRLRAMRMEASNKEVAAIMGVAKGTVDSNLFAVRKRNRGEDR